MDFKQEILTHYLDSDGLVTIDRDPKSTGTCGNALLLTGIFYSFLKCLGELTDEDVRRFKSAVDKCYREIGLLNRGPNKLDLESRDDYIGVATAAILCGTFHAEHIDWFGRNHHWQFDNEPIPFSFSFKWLTHKWSAWHGRFVGVVPFYTLCAGQRPVNFFEKKELDLMLWLDTQSSDLSGKILSLCVCLVYDSPMVDKWIAHFNERFGNVATLFSRYLESTEHPFASVEIKL